MKKYPDSYKEIDGADDANRTSKNLLHDTQNVCFFTSCKW